jgi:hypothetical protein
MDSRAAHAKGDGRGVGASSRTSMRAAVVGGTGIVGRQTVLT